MYLAPVVYRSELGISESDLLGLNGAPFMGLLVIATPSIPAGLEDAVVPLARPESLLVLRATKYPAFTKYQ